MVQPIPDGYAGAIPYLFVKGAAKAIDFYKAAFGAEEVMRLDMPGGMIGHAEIKIGGDIVMLADEHEGMGALGPETRGGTTVGFCVYVEDVDAAFAKAIEAGGKEQRPVQDQFYGDRSGTFIDPFGHQWTLATHVEDVTPQLIAERMAAMGDGSQEA